MDKNLVIRPASRDDAGDMVRLLAQDGYRTTLTMVIGRLSQLETTGLDQVLLAEVDDVIVGLLALHIVPALLHSDAPLAHVTALVVEDRARQNVERALLVAAEELAWQTGCDGIEVGSNNTRGSTHAFYTTLGYVRSQVLRKILTSNE